MKEHSRIVAERRQLQDLAFGAERVFDVFIEERRRNIVVADANELRLEGEHPPGRGAAGASDEAATLREPRALIEADGVETLLLPELEHSVAFDVAERPGPSSRPARRLPASTRRNSARTAVARERRGHRLREPRHKGRAPARIQKPVRPGRIRMRFTRVLHCIRRSAGPEKNQIPAPFGEVRHPLRRSNHGIRPPREHDWRPGAPSVRG